jgi:hypothetical protein
LFFTNFLRAIAHGDILFIGLTCTEVWGEVEICMALPPNPILFADQQIHRECPLQDSQTKLEMKTSSLKP